MKKTVLKILCVTAGVLLLTACAPQADPATSSSSTVPSTTTGPTTVPTTVISTTTKPMPQPNPYGPADFSKDGQWMALNGAKVRRGIDVSAYQGDVNWQKVKNDGIEFVFVRIGFRGYGSAGNMVEDKYVRKNYENATAAGLKVGVYFFSQAITEEEAREEAARIIEHAKAEGELEKQKVADEVKKEIILVATLMANKLVTASIDQKTQDSLIEETLREIGDQTWLS